MATTPEGIFPTFFLSGFECSTFDWHGVGRRDLVAETRHREHAREDYGLLERAGIGVAREGIPWPLVDRGDGDYDFSMVDPLIEAMNDARVLAIWDLCHYGYPDDTSPDDPDFVRRFAAYCRAAAEHVLPLVQAKGASFFTPINEITYFATAAGEWGLFAPFGRERRGRDRLRVRLCEAAIAGIRAIREVDPTARMVAMDPVVNVVAPRDRPDLVEAADIETYEDTFVASDILAGIKHPELGGSPDVLDIVGVNCYSFGQMEYREEGPHDSLDPGDPRIRPLADLLQLVADRYGRPVIISETSGLRDGRTAWLRDVMQESLAAVDRGIELHGLCLFPAVDMPDWNTGEWLHNGIADLEPDGDDLRRVPDEEYLEELHRWQRMLNRTEHLDEDPASDPVDLGDIIAAARRLRLKGDADWA
jgi:beta-glucosidase/6-phospho-beta-glucosidase/beta-galactosidase